MGPIDEMKGRNVYAITTNARPLGRSWICYSIRHCGWYFAVSENTRSKGTNSDDDIQVSGQCSIFLGKANQTYDAPANFQRLLDVLLPRNR